MFHFESQLPLTDPVLVFAIVLLIILLSPIVFSRFKIPGIIGLIVSGVILGPHGFHILERDASIVLFGTVGLLYIMFMAGLEMDMNDFKRNKNKSIVFGVLTFLFPFALGFAASRFILQYDLLASVLLASMFSTHTLIAYPIVTKLGIINNRTMAMIIGGTIITDAVVLLMLAVITNIKESALDVTIFIKLFGTLGLLIFIILWGVPRLGRWFFRNLESEGHSQYVFVLSVVFLSGFLAHVAGVEPIIGAFLAGLALNQLIPNSSTLMNRIDFVGNALFIPFFLISVGMLVDFRVLTKGPEALFIGLLIIVISFAGKWLGAFATQKIFRFSRTERQLIWGMSSGHAAATIAVVIIGFRLKLLDENVLNGTILLILVSCLGSSLIAEKAGRKIALEEESTTPATTDAEERILVPIANPETVERLVDMSVLIKNPVSTQPVFPLYVLQDRHGADERIARYQLKMENTLKNSGAEIKKELVFRVDLNVGNGILRAITELRITKAVIGWNGVTGSGKNLGSIIDRVVNDTTIQLLIGRLLQPVSTIKRIVLVFPEHAEREAGFPALVDTMLQLSRGAGASVEVFSTDKTVEKLKEYNLKSEKVVEIGFHPFQRWTDLQAINKTVAAHDLLAVVLARPFTLSYHDSMKKVPRLLSMYFKTTNVLVLYPEQR